MAFDQGEYSPETGPAETLGDTFRMARVAAGVSIEQVEYDLRIKAKYLEAIEDSDAGALPSRAYVDGFLKNYAMYLGMDPVDAVRRYSAENGHAPSVIPTVPIPPRPAKAANKGASTRAPRKAPLKRGLMALTPVLLFAGTAFAGYAGFVAARDAGLTPANLFASAPESEAQAPQTTAPQTTAPQTAANQTAAPQTTPAQTEPRDPVAEGTAEETEIATQPASEGVRVALVGDEPVTGRPDTLAYARTGSTPYWQAKPPALDPVDGPVSEIEPEEAGVLRADAPRSRWSSSAVSVTPPASIDGERIAAEARAALAEMLTPLPAMPEAAESPAEAALALDIDPAAPLAIGAETVETPPLFGPQVVLADPAPAVPAQPPRRFALIAVADTWVQVSDGAGRVAYTGILSRGEAYNIPSRPGLRLRTGNAGGLYIEVNGERFGPLGNSGAIMRNVPLDPGAVRASFTLSRAASLTQ